MESYYNQQLDKDKKFFKQSQNRNITTDFKKADINILLNRVKIDKITEKKKNIIFITSIFLSLSLTAYIIFR